MPRVVNDERNAASVFLSSSACDSNSFAFPPPHDDELCSIIRAFEATLTFAAESMKMAPIEAATPSTTTVTGHVLDLTALTISRPSMTEPPNV